jgi:hypothetical protein
VPIEQRLPQNRNGRGRWKVRDQVGADLRQCKT